VTQTSDGRKFTPYATAAARKALKQLPLQLPPAAYQRAMKTLGTELGRAVAAHVDASPFVVVTTPEDADFLTRGMLDALPDRAHLVCYWTTRQGNSASVHKEYVDPKTPKTIDTVIIAKSIISSGCIVRTNLEEFLNARKPKHIVIAAPVMLTSADDELRRSFPAKISKRFEFVTFAIDSRKEGDVVRPGVGGMVEERLGLTGRVFPDIVAQWRARPS
jgi:hypothetical protein